MGSDLCSGAVNVDGLSPVGLGQWGGLRVWRGPQEERGQAISGPAVGEVGGLVVELMVQGAEGGQRPTEHLCPGGL